MMSGHDLNPAKKELTIQDSKFHVLKHGFLVDGQTASRAIQYDDDVHPWSWNVSLPILAYEAFP